MSAGPVQFTTAQSLPNLLWQPGQVRSNPFGQRPMVSPRFGTGHGDSVRFGNAATAAAPTAATESAELPKQELKSTFHRIVSYIKGIGTSILDLGRARLGHWGTPLRNLGRNLYNIYANTVFLGALVIASYVPIKPLRRYIESRFLYEPERIVSRGDIQSDILKAKVHNVHFNSADGTQLHGWYIPAGKPDKPTIIFAHGRKCNIGYYQKVLEDFAGKDYGIFVFDYRGFGNSHGTPSEKGLYDDLEAAVKHIENYPDARYRVPRQNQILLGHSMGGAVAADVASRIPFKAVVLCSTFTTIKDALVHNKKQYSRFLGWLFRENIIQAKFDSLSKVPNIKSPLLIISGKDDNVTPPEMGRKLYEAATAPVKGYIELDGCDHVNIYANGSTQIFNEMAQILQRAYGAEGQLGPAETTAKKRKKAA